MMSKPEHPEDDDLGPLDPEEEETALVPIQRPPILGANNGSEGSPHGPLEFPAPSDDAGAEAAESPPPPQAAEAGSAPPEYPARVIAAISQLGRLIEERVSVLQASFEREVRAEATRERIVDRLHAELQEYKQDFLLKVQRPIFIDLIQLHDDIGKILDAQAAEDAEGAGRFRDTLDSLRTAILDILYRQGVEPFRTDGDEFDPRRQRAVTVVPTEDAARNKTVAVRLRPGFQSGDKILRAELVSVHTLRK